MEIIRKTEKIERIIKGRSAVTIGVFDGVHAGHQKVLTALEEAKEKGGLENQILVTFDRHPLSVTHPDKAPLLLTTLEEKLSILRGSGVDYVIVEEFSREYSETDYRAFIRDKLVNRLAMSHLVIGYDFRLGKGREGSPERIKRESEGDSFDVTVVPPRRVGGEIVSSTRIRNDIIDKRLDRATEYLTREYFFDSEVISGAGIGRDLGFPTANLSVPPQGKLVPPEGVYAVEFEMEGARHGGMMNIGGAPTVRSAGGLSLEVHVFGFSGDLYGESVRVHCIKYIREERRFGNKEELRSQLERDRASAREILGLV